MNTEEQTQMPLPRSPELMSRDDTALLVIDVQQKLVPAIANSARIVWNIRRLIDAATLLGLPRNVTEQYPQGLGATLPELAAKLPAAPSKLTFSCASCTSMLDELSTRQVNKLLLCGIETHVCVAQSALDLQSAGYRVYLAVDAVGSRFAIDHDIALRRLEGAGVTLTTTEAALFEWCQVAGTPEFKAISQLVRETPPS